jgi:hypothetical protein
MSWDSGISEKDWDMNTFHFEGETPDETISVYAKCPECCKFLKKGQLFMNGLGEARLKGWICKKHGEVIPYFDRY